MFNRKLEKRIENIENALSDLGLSKPQTDLVEKESKSLTDDYKRKAAYALNLVTVSVSQIVEYEDLVVLEQEYDAILNNINLQNIIHDEPLLDILKQILDVITFFKIQAKEKQFIEREYQQKMKNAIWSAVPNIGLIVAGGNPVTMAISLASQIGIGYMNYRKEKANTSLEKDKQMWQLERSAIEQLNGLRRELFSTTWKLADKYNFPDEYRLTEKQINQYNKILTDSDPLRRFERLDVMKKDFEAFPPFWYYLAHTAKEIADNAKQYEQEAIYNTYSEKALNNYQKCEKIYIELMREDVIYSTCALEQIPFLIAKGSNAEEISALLEKAVRLAGNNNDILQQAALVYLYLGKPTEAKDTLRRLVNEDYNTVFNAQLLSKVYINEKNRVEYDVLSERVENAGNGIYLIPYPEEGENETEKFYEQQKQNFKMQLTQFFEDFAEKSSVESCKLINFLQDKDDAFFKKENFSEIVERTTTEENVALFDPIDFLEKYVELLNEKCKALKESGLDEIFENEDGIDGDTIEEVGQIISAEHLKTVEQFIKKDFENKEEDAKRKELCKIICLVNWNKSDEDSPYAVLKQYCESICKKIDDILLAKIDVSDEHHSNPLSKIEMAINKLYTSQGWAIPYYNKKEYEQDIASKELITTNLEQSVIDDYKQKKKKAALIKESLNNVEGKSVLCAPKQIETFIRNNYLSNYVKKYQDKPAAIICTEQGFSKFAFILFADYFWYFKKGSFCFRYSYKDAANNCEKNQNGDELTINANANGYIIPSAKSIKPKISASDIDIKVFEDLLKKLGEM